MSEEDLFKTKSNVGVTLNSKPRGAETERLSNPEGRFCLPWEAALREESLFFSLAVFSCVNKYYERAFDSQLHCTVLPSAWDRENWTTKFLAEAERDSVGAPGWRQGACRECVERAFCPALGMLRFAVSGMIISAFEESNFQGADQWLFAWDRT